MARISILLTVLILLGISIGLQSFHSAFASSIALDGTSCVTFMGSWDGSTNTCTINNPPYLGGPYVYYTTASDELVIPSGTSLVILNPDFNQYRNDGTMTNHGKILVEDPGGMIGFQNDGTVDNYGTITISNAGFGSGIINSGTLNNYGTITFSNSGSHGMDNHNVIVNSGTITISNTDSSSFGLYNFEGTITNSGTITVSNTVGTGIDNSAAIVNNGAIDILCDATYVGNLPTGTPLNNVSCIIDNTPPVIVPTITGTLGNNGWYTSDVTISWSVTDPESTISSSTGCTSITISTDTAGVTLTCSATSAGGTDTKSVTIKRDTTAPTITAPSSITLISSTQVSPPLGTPTVNDNLDPSPVVINNAPASFTPGTMTTVTWTAIDNAGNSASSQQTITIQTPTQAIQNLLSMVNGMHLKKGTTDSLDDKLQEIIKNLVKSHGDDIKEKLYAFINEVKAQTGKSISVTQATQLINTSQAIINALPSGHDDHPDKDSK